MEDDDSPLTAEHVKAFKGAQQVPDQVIVDHLTDSPSLRNSNIRKLRIERLEAMGFEWSGFKGR
jgi:hypothetical protein